MKKILSIGLVSSLALLVASLASAHAVVSPKITGIGQYTEFSLAVPSEKPLATVLVKLLIPSGLGNVTPNVKAGWKINVVKQGNDVSEIDWTGGSIPAGQRDDFMFDAQAPSQPTTLNWKAYQTYSDGSVVSWDQDPKNEMGDNDFASSGPYSQTMVINDLTQPQAAPAAGSSSASSSKLNWALGLSILGVLFSLIALSRKQGPQA